MLVVMLVVAPAISILGGALEGEVTIEAQAVVGLEWVYLPAHRKAPRARGAAECPLSFSIAEAVG